MKNCLLKYSNLIITFLLGVVIFLFWYVRYPQAMSYQEQYQLFLWTSDYFKTDLSCIGGFADYVGEFLVQFYYVEWAGALVLAIVFMTFCVLIAMCFTIHDESAHLHLKNLELGICVSMLLLWYMGDESVLMSYVVALIITLSVFLLARRLAFWYDALLIPVIYWLVGPVAWLYVGLRCICVKYKLLHLALPLYMLVIHLIASKYLLNQWPLQSAIFGTNYYRVPLALPVFQVFIPVVIFLLAALSKKWNNTNNKTANWIVGAICVAMLFFADYYGYNKDKYELIKQDYLIRNERWSEVVSNAEIYQVKANFSSECVNLALAMTGQLSDRMFSFYQSGEDALVMPMLRDLTSNIPTMEAFYRLGMVNEAMRYAFDIQESILNGRKSGRLTKRVAECCIINGKYAVASKYLDILQHSLFYSSWAKDAKTYLGNEAWIDAHKKWGAIRKIRYQEDFLYNYDEMDKMFGILFQNNPQNKMALEYFLAQLLLKGDIQGFQHYLGWAQQYGGYVVMPYSYQDAMRCIQAQGNLPGSPYAEYVKRMMAQKNSQSLQDNGSYGASSH